MSKTWKIFWQEYTRHVFRKRFLVAVLTVPLMLIFILGISIITSLAQTDSRPIGYVDEARVLTIPPTPSEEISFFEQPIEITSYANEDDAQNALQNGQIQGYYLIPQDYLSTAHVVLITNGEVDSSAQYRFQDYLQENLLTGQPEAIINRVLEGSSFTIETPDQSRQMNEDDIANAVVPIFAGILFMMIIFTSGGYLMHAVIEEKENRTMEILVTSVSTNQLMVGKILGNLSVGITQMLIWFSFLLFGILAGQDSATWIAHIRIGWDQVLLMLGALIPTFIMIAGLMAMIGATVTESREAQQVSGLFTLPIMVPYWFTAQIMGNPNGPLAVGLSFFPLTAPVTLTLRAAFTPIPTWQIILNIALLSVCAVGSMWLAGRAFRMGMLSYGKRIEIKELFSRSQGTR